MMLPLHHYLQLIEVLGRVKGIPSAASPPLTRPPLLDVASSWAMGRRMLRWGLRTTDIW